MRLRILFHDNCFDGASSAALFASFYSSCIRKDAQIDYVGLSHGPGDPFAGKFLPPDIKAEHVCLDFRYTKDPRMDWWFDHHVSAFSTKEDERFFKETKNPRHFYDPAARSCTKFFATTVAKLYGYDLSTHQELIHWADIIDGAQFESPQAAVELNNPPLQLMTWVEANQNFEKKIRFIKDLQSKPLQEIVQQPYVQELLVPLLDAHHKNITLMKDRSSFNDGVVSYDIIDQGSCSPNKFISYYLFPECHYVVGLSRTNNKIKISVGSNPWYSQRRTVNIAELCAKYGGGGHPVVGAISLVENEINEARQITKDIVQKLQDAVLNHEK